MDKLSVKSRENFLADVRKYYREHGRHDLPWRLPEPDGSFDSYKILVSEIMLQQTQVPRVIPKHQSFLQEFPDLRALAAAPLGDVLVAWQGLGYNRRAKYLWQAAQVVVRDHGGQLPDDQNALEHLPAIGHNTAGAIRAYAFNQPALFVETNIRTVYIRHFFQSQTEVTDKVILSMLDQTLDRASPREFYWALMDYGSFLKQSVGNLSRASKTYAKQSKFHGSLRQIRGQVLRRLSVSGASKTELQKLVADDRLDAVLDGLEREGLICKTDSHYHLP